MPNAARFQYQILAESLGVFTAETPVESKWHQPLSEPVRQKINPRQAVVEIASGLTYSNWLPTIFEDSWHQPWSYPTKEMRRSPALLAGLQDYITPHFPIVPPGGGKNEWFNWWSEPVRLKKGLGVQLQKTLFAPERLLPPANVTMTMAATETNADVAVFAINVYDGASTTTTGQGAKVSITEIVVGGDPVGVRES